MCKRINSNSILNTKLMHIPVLYFSFYLGNQEKYKYVYFRINLNTI